jgi:hypothetical protein
MSAEKPNLVQIQIAEALDRAIPPHWEASAKIKNGQLIVSIYDENDVFLGRNLLAEITHDEEHRFLLLVLLGDTTLIKFVIIGRILRFLRHEKLDLNVYQYSKKRPLIEKGGSL